MYAMRAPLAFHLMFCAMATLHVTTSASSVDVVPGSDGSTFPSPPTYSLPPLPDLVSSPSPSPLPRPSPSPDGFGYYGPPSPTPESFGYYGPPFLAPDVIDYLAPPPPPKESFGYYGPPSPTPESFGYYGPPFLAPDVIDYLAPPPPPKESFGYYGPPSPTPESFGYYGPPSPPPESFGYYGPPPPTPDSLVEFAPPPPGPDSPAPPTHPTLPLPPTYNSPPPSNAGPILRDPGEGPTPPPLPRPAGPPPPSTPTATPQGNTCFDIAGLDLATRLGLVPCGDELPVQLCRGDKEFQAGGFLYQFFFVLANGTTRGFAQTNHGTFRTYPTSFVATSDIAWSIPLRQITCRIMSADDVSLDLHSWPPSVSVTETCNLNGITVVRTMLHKFAAADPAHCTPQLVPVGRSQ